MALPEVSSETVHGACVSINGRAVLIEGRSGDGRTDLALRLIDRGATLVADAQVICQRHDGGLLASPPGHVAGRIEIRGIGSVEMPHADRVPVDLLIAISDSPGSFAEETPRRRIAGVEVPVVPIAALEPSAPIKVELALGRLKR